MNERKSKNFNKNKENRKNCKEIEKKKKKEG